MVSKGYADCPWYLSVSPLRLVSWAGGTRRASKTPIVIRRAT